MPHTYHRFPRISVDTAVMGGKPCIRGMRVTVGMILGELSGGTTIDELLAGYPYLERDDVLDVIRYNIQIKKSHDEYFIPSKLLIPQ